jgi:hypothetical protein
MQKRLKKVRDLVEVRSIGGSQYEQNDLSAVVESYKFTPITSDLMSQWLKRLGELGSNEKTCFALAGKRGVGKSHFLSTFAALCEDPATRALVTDNLVRQTCEFFGGAEFKIVRVFRGSQETLVAEVASALRQLGPEQPNDKITFDALISSLAAAAAGVPPILMIDSNPGRAMRIARDDGPALAELAVAANKYGVFVGLALDDDISGADGPNVQVAGTYTIDYLDPQHLYQIVDSYVFPKKQGAHPEISEVYRSFRNRFAGFHWSEERFTSLYPLHPETLDVAPFIRFYIHEFALLGFASQAGLKIMGRPSDSLIGLDEMYDAVESKLRSHQELAAAFDSLDRIEKHLPETLSFNQKYVVRLALKYIFLSALKGFPATVNSIMTGMLIESDKTDVDLEQLLDDISNNADLGLQRSVGADGTPGYLLSGIEARKEKYEIPARWADQQDDGPLIELLKLAKLHFTDLDGTQLFADDGALSILQWNNSFRRGRLIWHEVRSLAGNRDEGRYLGEWQVILAPLRTGRAEIPNDGTPITAVWELPNPDPGEVADILAYRDLAESSDGLDDQQSVELNRLRLSLGRILSRILIEDARLIVNGRDVGFNEEDKDKHLVSYLFSSHLNSEFYDLYPEHPVFGALVSQKEVESLVSRFFLEKELDSPTVQKLAMDVALPLELAVSDGTALRPATESELLSGRFAALLTGSEFGTDEISITEIVSRLNDRPVGLSLEAIHLILTAMIAQCGYEFVTRQGSRIGRSTLDLQLVWDDIISIAPPLQIRHAKAEIAGWCELLMECVVEPSNGNIQRDGDVADCILAWHRHWKTRGIEQLFRDLHSENMSLRSWKKIENIRASMGRALEIVSEWLGAGGSADDVLFGMINCFKRSQSYYRSVLSDVEQMLSEAALNELRKIGISYLLRARLSDDQVVESHRLGLCQVVEKNENSGDPSSGIEAAATRFCQEYGTFFIRQHEVAAHLADGFKKFIRDGKNKQRYLQLKEMAATPWFDPSDRFMLGRMDRWSAIEFCSVEDHEKLGPALTCECGFDPTEDMPPEPKTADIFFRRSFDRFASNVIDAANSAEAASGVLNIRERLISALASEEELFLEPSDLEMLREHLCRA